MKENVGADKVKFLLDLCSEEDEEEEQDGERRKRVRRLACSLYHACKSIFYSEKNRNVTAVLKSKNWTI